ncbi:MAG: DUF6851 domain-containing protein [Bacteroidota bacterium]
MTKQYFVLFLLLFFSEPFFAQHSIARQWNEHVLDAIRADFARPTVHARNLFHTSIAMYDLWAFYEGTAETYFLGKTVHGFHCPVQPVHIPTDIRAAQEEAISYAVYRLIEHRFQDAPRAASLFFELDPFMESLGYAINNRSTDYACSPAALGNYIAEQLILFGLQDGSNEVGQYANQFYEPVNPPLWMEGSGNPNIQDLNRWQPLRLGLFIDQGGTLGNVTTPEFLSPEWGSVLPFSLKEEDSGSYFRDGDTYTMYHDPGPPPYLDLDASQELSDAYKWGHALVSVWSSHLDPEDGIMWDISPASIGNITEYPEDFLDYPDFYNLIDGGDPSPGHAVNPHTGQPYEPQMVPRADYARVLAEFWADGPDSETPPGHWFTIFNYVSDHPDLVKQFEGKGPVLSDLEWDVKGYFLLGGTMHDAAITAWSIKGWYDYIRPVSALRGMAELGQSTDPNLPNYHPEGIPLIPGYIEQIQPGDSLSEPDNLYAYDIMVKAWRGTDYIFENPFTNVGGVDWIRASIWFPYQRPSFVTPPFAGYVSGHSTYSRAAAELLTAFTGDAFFPGGMGEFYCPEGQFLVFEEGPSMDVTLQWATYRDASDQCSLSRIWGGIHPPCDDIPGRFIGIKVGNDAFEYGKQYFERVESPITVEAFKMYPNPLSCVANLEFEHEGILNVKVYASNGQFVLEKDLDFVNNQSQLYMGKLPGGIYIVTGFEADGTRVFSEKFAIQSN